MRARDLKIYSGRDGFQKMLEDKEIEAVISAAPSNIHEERGLAIAQAGKHLLIEKPLALVIAVYESAFSRREIGVADVFAGKIGRPATECLLS